MSGTKVTLKEISAIIPNCGDEKDVFIKACEAIEKEHLPNYLC